MNIAFLVCPENPVPPINYGGAERVTDIMVRKLLEKGHSVDLYCGENSTCPATNKFMFPHAMSQEKYMFDLFCSKYKEYTAAIDYTAFHLIGQNFPKLVISLMGGDPFKKYPHDEVYNKVYKSREFATFNGNEKGLIFYDAIEYDTDSTVLGKGNGNYALYVGTIHPMKGVHIAAQVCKEIELKLKVYGPIRDVTYWNSFKEDVEYCGLLGIENREQIFGMAKVFLHPVKCVDSDPMAPKEAMLRGTPVVANKIGGITSTIEEGINGYFAETIDEYKESIHKCLLLNRQEVRDNIIKKVCPDRCVDCLLQLINKVKQGDI